MFHTLNPPSDLRRRVATDLALLIQALDRQRGNAVRTADEAIDAAIGAVLALAVCYRHLYELDPGSDFVDLPDYFGALGQALRTAYLDRLQIRLDCRFADISTQRDAARDMGGILVELVAHAAKHVLGDRGGRISIDLSDKEAALVLTVAHSGRGVDRTGACADAPGLRTAAKIASGLGGRLDIGRSAPGRGAAISLSIPRCSRRADAPLRPH